MCIYKLALLWGYISRILLLTYKLQLLLLLLYILELILRYIQVGIVADIYEVGTFAGIVGTIVVIYLILSLSL